MGIQVFDTDQLHYIKKGGKFRKSLIEDIDEALNNNAFMDNYLISSLPGLGKSFEMERQLSKMKTPPLKFEGSSSIFTYFIELATAIYLNKGQPFPVVNDDCDVLFEDKNINITKKMFDDARKLKYGKNWKSLLQFCSPLQAKALESFADPSKAGIELDVSNVTFITLTNRYFPTVNQVENCDEGTPKHKKYTDLYAIRRRTEYKEIHMDNMELWGYVADVVLNDKICEKFIPNINIDYKHQILEWCYNRWEDKITERNLSVIEKMTKDIVKSPKDYKDIWDQKYAR